MTLPTDGAAVDPAGIEDDEIPKAMIHLDGVGKTYPGSSVAGGRRASTSRSPRARSSCSSVRPAAARAPRLRLINRMIEPTTGRIIFDGEDVTDVNPDQLRRRIGYVIQQIGLFPHQTIAQNIATVPKLLGLGQEARSATGSTSCSM